MLVKDVMIRDLTSVSPNTNLVDVISLFFAHKTSGFPVVDDGGVVVGFISEKDVMKAALPGYHSFIEDNFVLPDLKYIHEKVLRVSKEPVSGFMAKDPVVFDENENLSGVIMTLFRKDIRKAPVIRGKGLVGIVNREEILRGFLRASIEESH